MTRQLLVFYAVVAACLLAVAARAVAAPLTGIVTLVPTGAPVNLPLLQDEQAIQQQIDTQFNLRWHTANVQFSLEPSAGIQIYFWPQGPLTRLCGSPAALACHGQLRNGEPAIWVMDRIPAKIEEIALDHEILELLVDPTPLTNGTFTSAGDLVEVCDPVEGYAYHSKIDPGIWLSPFVYPSYFNDYLVSHRTAFMPPRTVAVWGK